MRLSNLESDLFKYKFERSTNMYESSYSLFFRATTEIEAGWHALGEPIRVVTLAISGVSEILCSFRVLLYGETV